MDDENTNSSKSEESTPKRSRIHEKDCSEASPDRLSELPELLLVQILSLLPMKDAVSTGVLSKRWINLWNHVDKIVYRYDIEENNTMSFISFVDSTLLRCTCPNIKKFALHISDHDFYPHPLDEWLQWAYSRKVKILKVVTWNLDLEDRYIPQDWFFHNSSLVELAIADSDFTVIGPVVSWASLRSLYLRNVRADDVQIEKILLGCPMLENLVLENVSKFSRLNIVSPRLERLSVITFPGHLLLIDAPWLLCLEISGYFDSDKIQLINLSSLVEVNLTFVHENHSFRKGKVDSLKLDLAIGLLERFCHVEELIMGAELIQALSVLKLLGKPCPLFKCKHLTISLRVMRYELPGIIYLLQNSPHMEMLVIEMEFPSFWQRDFGRFLIGIFKFEGAAYLSTERVDLPQLKSMKIAHLKNFCSPNFGIELAEYILSNARVLEKLVITSENNESCRCSRNCASRYESLLSRKSLHSSDWREVGKFNLQKK